MSCGENYGEMNDRGYLVTPDRGLSYHMSWMGNTVFYDATNPGAQKFVWEKCKKITIKTESAVSG